MSILKGNLDESLLTQQEQVALRTCLRVTTLAEGIIQLEKLKDGIMSTNGIAKANHDTLNSIKEIEKYLQHRIETTIASYNAPSLPQLSTKETSKTQ